MFKGIFSMFNFAMWSFMFFWDVEFASYYAVSSCFCDLVKSVLDFTCDVKV